MKFAPRTQGMRAKEKRINMEKEDESRMAAISTRLVESGVTRNGLESADG